MAKTLIIITGPQGSGNHLFSKIFAASKQVFGWYELSTTYWVAHDQEPFAEAWHNPDKLEHITFDNYVDDLKTLQKIQKNGISNILELI